MSDTSSFLAKIILPLLFAIGAYFTTWSTEYAFVIFVLAFALKGAVFLGFIPFVGVFKAHEAMAKIIEIAAENTVIQEGTITAVMHIVFTVSAGIITFLISIILPIALIAIFVLGVIAAIE